MMRCVNKPEISKVVVWFYGGLAVFILALVVIFAYVGFSTSMWLLSVAVLAVLGVVEAFILLLMRSLYRTEYIIGDDVLVIRTSRLIGGEKKIPIRAIRSVEKTLIPFGIRLFGASFHGGYYYIPSLGRAFLAITNFRDGLLIRTTEGNYLITPRDPADFKGLLEKKVIESLGAD